MTLPAIRTVTLHGATCSGKSDAGSFLRKKDWCWIEASDTLKQLLEEESLDNTLQSKSQIFKMKGRDAVAKRIREEIKDEAIKFQRVCITGFRMPEEIACFSEATGLLTIFVEASTETRFLRSTARQRRDMSSSFEEFQKNTQWEFDLGLREIKKRCKVTVENEGTIEDFHKRLMELIR